MSREAGNKARQTGSSPKSVLRAVGRTAIWVAVGVVLVRGVGAILSPPVASAPSIPVTAADQASSALAVHFARTWLDDPSPRELSPFLAVGAHVGSGRPPAVGGAEVAQAEVTSTQKLGGGGEVLTVACELRDARTLYLAVPIVPLSGGRGGGTGCALRSSRRRAWPGPTRERPRPLAGPDAAAIAALVGKFLPGLPLRAARRAISPICWRPAPR